MNSTGNYSSLWLNNSTAICTLCVVLLGMRCSSLMLCHHGRSKHATHTQMLGRLLLPHTSDNCWGECVSRLIYLLGVGAEFYYLTEKIWSQQFNLDSKVQSPCPPLQSALHMRPYVREAVASLNSSLTIFSSLWIYNNQRTGSNHRCCGYFYSYIPHGTSLAHPVHWNSIGIQRLVIAGWIEYSTTSRG